MATSEDDQRVEQMVFDCLGADDPAGELTRRTSEWSEADRGRAVRALEAVLVQEREMAAPSFGAPPPTLAGYRILETLASGGMGVVYLAEQSAPLRRRVAIKVIRDGMASEEMRKRFELERQALALMDHESIARIYDADSTADGRPFLVMEFVSGQPITTYCDGLRLDTTQRLELFEQVCLAIQHAHQRGIIHRDLKPANVLIASNRERPIPKVIDFGLARPTHGRLVDVAIHTQHGAFVGTPAYMSPEQAEMSAAEIDTRTDIYSLGALLYELLTGSLPLLEDELRGTPAEVQQRIADSEVPRPSSRVSTVGASASDIAAKRRTSPATLAKRLEGDLDWVILKAMERDRSRRYPTASEFAADIRRCLADEPVLAGPPTFGYRVKKFVRRHRRAVTATALVALVVLIGGIVSTMLFIDARRNLEQFNLLRFRVELDDAIRIAGGLDSARPAQVPALRAWLEERAAPLRTARATVAMALEVLGEDPEDSRQRFLAKTMREVAADLEAFFAPDSGLASLVAERLAWAESVRERSIERYAERWQEVQDSLQQVDARLHADYGKSQLSRLDPQLGLVPIGINPVTGMWEFYHLRSAADPNRIPSHHEDGTIDVDEGTGIVFVLLPGGKAWIGVQSDDDAEPNYDPLANRNGIEGPPRHVEVEPFFLGRFEITKSQWQRMSDGGNPSVYKPGVKPRGAEHAITGAYPVEAIGYGEAAALMKRHGLQLPTEIQWAYGCRAGSTWAWSPGPRIGDLDGYANVHDQTSDALYDDWGEPAPFADRYVYLAPVGSFGGNAFGLHDMHGNVMEWCRKRGETDQVYARGGAFSLEARYARCGGRFTLNELRSGPFLGARAMRGIQR